MVAAIEAEVERTEGFGSVFVDSFLPRPFVEAEAEEEAGAEVEVDAFFNSSAGAGAEESGFEAGGAFLTFFSTFFSTYDLACIKMVQFPGFDSLVAFML